MSWLQLTLEAGDLDAEILSDWFEEHGAVSVTLVDADADPESLRVQLAQALTAISCRHTMIP